MFIDIHSHVLPGIDDGPRDWDTCLEMLFKSVESGAKAIIATPHYHPWKKAVATEEIINLCREAEQKFCEKHGIVLDIYPGHEIYYSVDIVEKLRSGSVLTLGQSRYVLVEFQLNAPYQTLYKAVRELRDSGYTPIIAHVERYTCLKKVGRIDALKEIGAFLQVNADSHRGPIWDRRSRWVRKCLKKKKIDFLASDMHDLKERTPIAPEKMRWVHTKLEPQYQEELLYGNAEAILNTIKG